MFVTSNVTEYFQDVLENFFSQMRAIGGSDSHPGPAQAIQRLKVLCLGMYFNSDVPVLYEKQILILFLRLEKYLP